MCLWVCLHVWVSVCGCAFEYLDPADSLLGLHHAYVLGWVPLRQQLSGAQVVSSKDNSINQVFWFAGSWDWAREKQRGWWLTGRHREGQSTVRLKGSGVRWRGCFNHCSQCAVWRNEAKHLLWRWRDGDNRQSGTEQWDGHWLWADGGAVLVGGWAEINLCLWYVDVDSQTPTRGHNVLSWSEGADRQLSPSHIIRLSICPEAGKEHWKSYIRACDMTDWRQSNTWNGSMQLQYFDFITKQVCRQINLPSTKLGKDATFFAGWKTRTGDDR